MRVKKPVLPSPLPPNQRKARGVDALDDLWFDYPTSSQPQPSHRQELLDLQCDLAVLTEQTLTLSAQNYGAIEPNYELTKDLYYRLARWKTSLIKMVDDKAALLPIRTFLL